MKDPTLCYLHFGSADNPPMLTVRSDLMRNNDGKATHALWDGKWRPIKDGRITYEGECVRVTIPA